MKNNPILIVLGEPNSIFSEILIKTIKKKIIHKLNKPIIIIGSVNLFKAQIKLSEKSQNENFLKSKIISAEFFDFHILPRVESHFKIVTKGATIIQSTDDSFV